MLLFEVNFEAFGDDSGVIVYKDKSEYEIKKGKLNYSTNEYTDAMETNSTAKVEIDESGFGFKCVTLNPVSTYWYFDKDAVNSLISMGISIIVPTLYVVESAISIAFQYNITVYDYMIPILLHWQKSLILDM